MRATLVAMTLLAAISAVPALADNADGTIKSIDKDKATGTMTDGKTYDLPGEFDYTSIKPGMKVFITYEKIGNERYVSGIDPADQ